jgi:hypothetical protein
MTSDDNAEGVHSRLNKSVYHCNNLLVSSNFCQAQVLFWTARTFTVYISPPFVCGQTVKRKVELSSDISVPGLVDCDFIQATPLLPCGILQIIVAGFAQYPAMPQNQCPIPTWQIPWRVSGITKYRRVLFPFHAVPFPLIFGGMGDLAAAPALAYVPAYSSLFGGFDLIDQSCRAWTF